MGIASEIERKFLIEHVPADLARSPRVPIEQGYLAIDEESEVRLRRAGESLTLTIKHGRGESRQESEVGLAPATFDDLWPESEGRRVEKSRSRIDLESGLVAEIDEYGGGLAGISVVEVEFETETAASIFDPPDWFGRELTGDPAWANQTLAVAGRPEKYLEFRLRPGEEPGSGTCRVIASRAAQAAAAVRRAGVAEDPVADVHEARKCLKKVRSALRLLRYVLPDEERRSVNASVRDAARHLATARDSDVKITTLSNLLRKQAEPAGARQWRSELEAEAAGLRGKLTPERLTGVGQSIESVARGFRGRELAEATEAIAGNARRTYLRGRKAMKRARNTGEAEAFHDWRKRAKDLRYQLEILEPRMPAEIVGTRRQATDLAGELGDLHDFDVLAEDLSGRDLDGAGGHRLAGLIADRREHTIEECLRLGVSTYEGKPHRFTSRIGEFLYSPDGGPR